MGTQNIDEFSIRAIACDHPPRDREVFYPSDRSFSGATTERCLKCGSYRQRGSHFARMAGEGHEWSKWQPPESAEKVPELETKE